MKIKRIKKDKKFLNLELEDIDVSLANAIRRTILSEVPTLAVEEVRFIDNTSSLYDETIAHRIGLVPIKTDLGLFNFRDECSCKGEGCGNCVMTLTIDKKGPATVYSDDIKSDSKTEQIKGVPIVKLGNGQRLSLEADAVLGTGKTHAKWQPAVASYKHHPKIEIRTECDLCGECVEACPKNILEISSKKLKVTDEKECVLCIQCMEVCELDAIKVEDDDRRIIFKVESIGAMPPYEIFKKSCDILEEKAKTLSKIL
jgi:DNA-directed RNA polymerase subunit D